ncbi:hypothetical protein Q4490_10935 [Neptunomonas phycophila]|jgi:hypothetical protein|uniref:Uncharacterized protein n=1 Tax=Neptunomonas phycophila TaxID=1572645 RepID=A0AAW7XIE6_9GAMM|nr:hypothetical protein [Neptunomonas phycophila]MDO6454078.1 hypothetical protein [Neptunomonas phycophila]
MQEYRLLGTVTTSLTRQELATHLQALGWRILSADDEETLLHNSPVMLALDSETESSAHLSKINSILLSASYEGEPATIEPLINELIRLSSNDEKPLQFSIDLFGDAARLVRRFIG